MQTGLKQKTSNNILSSSQLHKTLNNSISTLHNNISHHIKKINTHQRLLWGFLLLILILFIAFLIYHLKEKEKDNKKLVSHSDSDADDKKKTKKDTEQSNTTKNTNNDSNTTTKNVTKNNDSNTTSNTTKNATKNNDSNNDNDSKNNSNKNKKPYQTTSDASNYPVPTSFNKNNKTYDLMKDLKLNTPVFIVSEARVGKFNGKIQDSWTVNIYKKPIPLGITGPFLGDGEFSIVKKNESMYTLKFENKYDTNFTCYLTPQLNFGDSNTTIDDALGFYIQVNNNNTFSFLTAPGEYLNTNSHTTIYKGPGTDSKAIIGMRYTQNYILYNANPS